MIQVMPHIMPCLTRFLDGGFKVFVSLLLQGQQLILLPQSGVSIQTGRHQQEDCVEYKQQNQEGDAEDNIALKHPAGIERCRIDGNHKEIERDEHQRQNPEHIPRLRKIIVLNHRSHRMGRRIIGGSGDQPADRVIDDTRPQAEPRLCRYRLDAHQHDGVERSGQAV